MRRNHFLVLVATMGGGRCDYRACRLLAYNPRQRMHAFEYVRAHMQVFECLHAEMSAGVGVCSCVSRQ